MKNKRIVRAYDSINPSLTDKQRMLDQILQEANLEEKREKTLRKPAPRVHTARAKPYKKNNPLGLIAASLAVFLLAGFLLTQVLRQPSDISATQPEQPVITGTAYDAVLAKYKTALEEGWTQEQCQIEDICSHITTTNYSALDVGYAVIDLDRNGREELVITNGQGLVWDLYTLLEDETPVHVYTQEEGWPVYRLYENGVICMEDFDPGQVYEFYVYRDGAFTGPELTIRQSSGMFTCEPAGEETYFITSEEAEGKMAEYKLQKLDHISLLTLVSDTVAEKYRYGNNVKYAAIIAKYNQAIAEGWSREQCEIEGISTRVQSGFDVTKAGYTFLDLDGDGREELIIAEESTDRTDNIWDIYTILEDGTPIQLWVDEMDGGQCRLYEDNVISIAYSMKDELEQTFYKLEEGKLAVLESLQWEDEDTVFHTDAEGNTRQITSREGQAISYAYESQKLDLTWFAGIPDYLRDTDAVEQYTPILEKYRTALTESWTLEQCQKNDISPNILYSTSITNELGWCLLDLDKNGVEELIISDGTQLIDLYTIMPMDDAPSHLISAYPDSYVLCRNGRIQKQEVCSASGPTYWRWYTMSGTDLMLQRVLYYENNQYSYGTSEDDLQSISKDEAGNIIVGSSAMPLALTPLVENESISSDVEKSYGRTLSTYRQAIAHDWNPGQCAENGISLMVGYYGDYVNDLGYAMMDLDSNGTEELFITDGINIYDMYTLSLQEPVHIISASERITYNLKAGNVIYNRGSGGAATTLHVFYRVEDDILMVQEAYIYDAYLYPDSPWFFSDGENYGDPCGDFDAQAAIDAHKTVRIPFISFE